MMMTMTAEVVPLGVLTNDIPAGLRRLAERIEAGDEDLADIQFVVALAVDRKAAFTAFGLGQCSILEAIGACARAVSHDLVLDLVR
jgi:hypothetical protein